MQNPATRPLVKSLMRVLSFLMGRRRVHVPKALRKQVLMLVLELLDLRNPTEVAVATYMTKNLVRGNRAADEFLLDWEDIEAVPSTDGASTLPALREMTPAEAGEAEECIEEPEIEESKQEEQATEETYDAGALRSATGDGVLAAARAAIVSARAEVSAVQAEMEETAPPTAAAARKRRCEAASSAALETEARLKGVKMFRVVTKKDRVQRGRVRPLHCCSGCTGKLELAADGSLDVSKACPVHMMLYSKEQQARRVRVEVKKLRGCEMSE